VDKAVNFPKLCKKLWIKEFPMSVSVSQAVYGEVQDKVVEKQAIADALAAQLAAAQGAVGEWQAILTEVYIAGIPPVPAPAVDDAGI
jgi:hypothetical protein